MKKNLTAILTVYKRGNLKKQLEALLAQTKKIEKFIFNVNNEEEFNKYKDVLKLLKKKDYLVVRHSKNLGVWSRFFLAYNCETEFVYILDDDVIPGNKRIEKCLETSKKDDYIIGSFGSIFKGKARDDKREIIVNPAKNTLVNISGQSWFFKKKFLSEMLYKLPEKLNKICGEELVISWNGYDSDILTIVLGVSKSDKETRGNKEPGLGTDKNSGYILFGEEYKKFYKECLKNGYNPARQLEINQEYFYGKNN